MAYGDRRVVVTHHSGTVGMFFESQLTDFVEYGRAFRYVADHHGDGGGNVGRHVVRADGRGDNFQLDAGSHLAVERRAVIADGAGVHVNGETFRSAIAESVGHRLAFGVGRSDHADIAGCRVLGKSQLADFVEHGIAFLHVLNHDTDFLRHAGLGTVGAN